MKKENKNIIWFLAIGALLLLSFKKAPKKKGSVIVTNPTQDNYYLKKGASAFDESNNLLYTAKIDWLINDVIDTGSDYQFNFIDDNGQQQFGYAAYNDVILKN